MKSSSLSTIETLEARIAPATIASFALAANGKSATYTDVDGDLVKVKISKGKFLESDFNFGSDDQLATLDLTRVDGKFAKSNLTITAKTPSGVWSDGLVHIGVIEAAGVDLGQVKVDGNLWSIHAGNDNLATTGVKALSVESLGRLLFAAGTTEDYYTDIDGKLGKLQVINDVSDAEVEVNGDLGKVTLGGSLIGGDGDESGSIYASGNIGAVKIKGSIFGGAGEHSGQIATGVAPSGGSIKSVTVNGSLMGGSGSLSGEIGSNTRIGFIKIGENIEGGTIAITGALNPTKSKQATALGSLTVGGDVTNATILLGYNSDAVPVQSAVALGKVLIEGNWSASSLAVGVADSTSDGFGRNDSLINGGGNAAIIAKISSITIKGTATGSASSSADHFGITAEQISKAKINGTSLDVSGTANLLLDTTNGDFRLVEVNDTVS